MKVFERIEQRQHFTEEERPPLQVVRQLVREKIAPRAAQYDREGEFPWANVRDLNALELNTVFLPPPYGVGLSFACYQKLVHEISQGCASTGTIWTTTFHATNPVIAFGSDEPKSRFLPTIARGGLGALAITEPMA